MKTNRTCLTSVLLLAGLISVSGRPVISRLALSGQPQTAYDSFHPYTTFSASPGANVSLSVVASGTGPLRYQWRFNQSDLPGETNAAISFLSLSLTNAGDYTVVVTNLSGSVTSHVASLC
jgi:hypothetical protein